MAARHDIPDDPDPLPTGTSGAEPETLVRELRDALRGSERRFEAIVGALTDGVTIRDRHDQIIYANSAAITTMGFASWAEMSRSSPAEIMTRYDAWDENGRPISMEDIPSVRILRGLPAPPLLMQTVHRTTRARHWALLKAAPLLDEAGNVDATITIIEDVTERRRAELEATFLATAGDVLASSLDYEQTLRNVAELAVPRIVDWCAVDLVAPGGGRRSVTVAHADPARLALAERLRAYEPDQLDPDRGLGRVFRTGEPILVPDISDAMLADAAVDEEHLRLLRSVGMSSAMLVPVALGDRILGAMTLVTAESRRVLDESDLRLAEQVAIRAAVAIENSRLYSERTQIAHTLQQSLAPSELPEIPGYELATIYVPAVAGAEVGGDFYDAWQVDDGWILVIGDVTGKGATAAALTALVRHTLRAVSDYETSPARMLAKADRALKRQPTLSICTALCLRIDAAGVTVAVGGHPLPLYVDDAGVRAVGAAGPLLGAFPDADWTEETFQLGRGASLVTYTDGVTDAVGEGGIRYGLERFSATLSAASERGAHRLIERLSSALDDFQAGVHVDDTAVLVVHRNVT